jgi:hypothetical protein
VSPDGRSIVLRRFLVLGAALGVMALLPGPAGAEIAQWPGNGHWYEFVEISVPWEDARFMAQSLTYIEDHGHLATITSQGENDFIATTFASGEAEFFAWIAGYEPADDGVWVWGAGPETGTQFSLFGVPTAPYSYANWGGIEPNDFAPGEDFAAMNLGDTYADILPGEWGDAPDPGPDDPVRGYVVEYSPESPVGSRSWSRIKSLFLDRTR